MTPGPQAAHPGRARRLSSMRRSALVLAGLAICLSAPARAERHSNMGPFAIEKLVGPPSALHALISTGVDCPKAPEPVVSLDTESRYDPKDRKAIEVDEDRAAAYREKVAPVRDYLRAVVEAANRSVAEPHARRAWADCAAGLLDGWAEAGALSEMETTTAKLIRGSQIAGLSLAALQLGDALDADDPRMGRIAAWLAGLARDGRAFVDSRPEASSSRANHRYWNGLAAAAAGSLAGDGALIDWGIDSARIGLAQVDANGFLPLELARGKRARDYHIYAIAPLVMIAEIAASRGLDLYAEHDHALRRLGGAVIASIADPEPMAAAAGAPQLPFKGDAEGPPSHRLAWLEPFLRRTPNEEGAALLAAARPTSYSALGGDLTLLFSQGLNDR